MMSSFDQISNVDKYTMLKLKEVSRKKIPSDLRSPLVKTVKKSSSSKNKKTSGLKKSGRSSIFL